MTYATGLFLAISFYSSDQCVSNSQRTDSACWEPQLHCGKAVLRGGSFSAQHWQMKEARQLSTFPIPTTAFPPYEASACSMQCSYQGNHQESKFLCTHWDLMRSPTCRGSKKAVLESPGFFLSPACNRLARYKLAKEYTQNLSVLFLQLRVNLYLKIKSKKKSGL